VSNDLLALAAPKGHLRIIGSKRITAMPHDFEGLDWANNHAAFSTAVTSIFATLMRGFDRLSARKFDAPWQTELRSCECNDA
jgi:hypothetical protein